MPERERRHLCQEAGGTQRHLVNERVYNMFHILIHWHAGVLFKK